MSIRIASICPSNTELLAAMGLAPYLVGVDNYSDYPAHAVNHLPRLGPDLNIDIDQLAALQPDLVVSSLSVPGMEKVVADVAAAHLRQVILSPHTLTDMLADFDRIVSALGRRACDIDLITSVKSSLVARIERITSATCHIDCRPTLYWEWWPKPYFSPAGENWLTEISQLAGCRNIFADVPGNQVQDDGTRITAQMPDWCLLVWTGVAQHRVPLAKVWQRCESWQRTPAFRHRRVIALAEGLYCRPSPRLIDGLEQLLSIVHPDTARALNLPAAQSYGPILR